jgi:hypothetical protein
MTLAFRTTVLHVGDGCASASGVQICGEKFTASLVAFAGKAVWATTCGNSRVGVLLVTGDEPSDQRAG